MAFLIDLMNNHCELIQVESGTLISLSSVITVARRDGEVADHRGCWNPVQRRSILYLSLCADPPAGRTELGEIFGVSQQRVSQILGAHKNRFRWPETFSTAC